MSQKVTIDCGEGKNAYQVVLTVDDLEAFYKADNSPEVAGKKGEDRVKALLADGSSSIWLLDREKNGKRNNGPHGEPGHEQYDSETGELEGRMLYENGIKTNGPNGEPHYVGFREEGALNSIGYCQNGEPNNGPNGEPSGMMFYDDGQLAVVVLGGDDDKIILNFDGEDVLESMEHSRECMQHKHCRDLEDIELVESLTTAKEVTAYAEQHKVEIAGYFSLAEKLVAKYSRQAVAPAAAAKAPRNTL